MPEAMATKVAYYRPVGLGPGFRECLERFMIGNLYDGKRLAGFLVRQIGKDGIESSYVQKWVREQALVDPLGNEYKSKTVRYSVQEVLFDFNAPSLAIVRPGLSFRALLGMLGMACKVEFKPLEWRIDRLCTDICMLIPGAYVCGVVVTDCFVSPSTFATIRLDSSADVRREAKRYFKSEQPRYSSVSIQVRNDGESSPIEFSRVGRVIFPDNCAEKTRTAIMQYLKSGTAGSD